MIELVLVFTLMGIMSALAVPQLVGQRRLRTASVSQRDEDSNYPVPDSRQSHRESFTFQYNNITKQILIIDNNASGVAVLNSPAYPNNPGSPVVTDNFAGSGRNLVVLKSQRYSHRNSQYRPW